MIQAYKIHNPLVDIREQVFYRNDGIKFDEIKNKNSFIKIVIQSEYKKIYVECSHDKKHNARMYAAQKFLRVKLKLIFLEITLPR